MGNVFRCASPLLPSRPRSSAVQARGRVPVLIVRSGAWSPSLAVSPSSSSCGPRPRRAGPRPPRELTLPRLLAYSPRDDRGGHHHLGPARPRRVARARQARRRRRCRREARRRRAQEVDPAHAAADLGRRTRRCVLPPPAAVSRARADSHFRRSVHRPLHRRGVRLVPLRSSLVPSF